MRDIDLLMVEEMTSFKPSDKQTALKMLIQDRVSPGILGKLTPGQVELLEPYIAPFSLGDLIHWCRDPKFFYWLLTPDDHLLTIHQAKRQAADTVISMMTLDVTDECINPKLAMLKLKAAELLLRTDMKREQKVSQTLKITQQVPKHLANKSTEALEAELKRLRESV